jgi:hypothetical protein
VVVTVICEVAEVELLADNVHQVWSEVASQRLPFIESLTVLLPPAIANFKESEENLKMALVTTGSGVGVPFFLQETENVIIATIKKNKICNFFI